MTVLRVLLTTAAFAANALTIAITLFTLATSKELDTSAQIVCVVLVGVIVVNTIAIQFGARLGRGRTRRDDTARLFD